MLSSVGANVIATHAPDYIYANSNPPFLRWAIESFDLVRGNKLSKSKIIYIIKLIVVILDPQDHENLLNMLDIENYAKPVPG
jgi:hypothetical protein